MKKLLICGAAAAALVGLAPAIGQTAQTAVQAPKAAKAHTRADVQAMIATHFARLDADRDGFLTRAEADAAMQARRAKPARPAGERLDRRFDRLDSDNNGSISRAEFDAAHAQRAERRGHRMGRRAMRGHFAGRMFAMADANNDQRVSLAEAQAAALGHFDKVDANRDGQISREERRQMRRHLINERRPG